MGTRPRTGNHHHGGAPHRDTGQKPHFTVTRSTPKQIADDIAFENGLGGGSASEYANIVRAAQRGYDAGLAAGNPGTASTAGNPGTANTAGNPGYEPEGSDVD